MSNTSAGAPAGTFCFLLISHFWPQMHIAEEVPNKQVSIKHQDRFKLHSKYLLE